MGVCGTGCRSRGDERSEKVVGEVTNHEYKDDTNSGEDKTDDTKEDDSEDTSDKDEPKKENDDYKSPFADVI